MLTSIRWWRYAPSPVAIAGQTPGPESAAGFGLNPSNDAAHAGAPAIRRPSRRSPKCHHQPLPQPRRQAQLVLGALVTANQSSMADQRLSTRGSATATTPSSASVTSASPASQPRKSQPLTQSTVVSTQSHAIRCMLAWWSWLSAYRTGAGEPGNERHSARDVLRQCSPPWSACSYPEPSPGGSSRPI